MVQRGSQCFCPKALNLDGDVASASNSWTTRGARSMRNPNVAPLHRAEPGEPEVLLEPVARKLRYLLQRARLLEQMRCTRNDLEPFLAGQLSECFAVQVEDEWIVAADDQERGSSNVRQRGRRHV